MIKKMKNVIEVKNLKHYYGNKKIYDNLNFEVQKGKVVGLLGKNGVGKTTLINILMGFLKPNSGECFILGENSHQISENKRKKIALLHEGHLSFDFMTIEQIERFYSAFYENWNRDTYYDLISLLGLKNNHKISNMSYGQRSQVVLGLIFAQNPELLVLDDYSMGLDAGYRRLFLDYLSDFVKDGDKTVFVTSHIVQDLENLVDDVILLNRGGEIIKSDLNDLLNTFHAYTLDFSLPKERNIRDFENLLKNDVIKNVEIRKNTLKIYSYEDQNSVFNNLLKTDKLFSSIQAEQLTSKKISLEDAFLGLMGRY